MTKMAKIEEVVVPVNAAGSLRPRLKGESLRPKRYNRSLFYNTYNLP